MSTTQPDESGPKDVYRRFIEELDALTIKVDDPVVAVIGDLTRAVKRAQMVVDGELAPVALRANRAPSPGKDTP